MLVYDAQSDSWYEDGGTAIGTDIAGQPGAILTNDSTIFDNASRLADKLFGAFSLRIDNAAANQALADRLKQQQMILAAQPTFSQQLATSGVWAILPLIIVAFIGVFAFSYLRK